MCIDPHQTGFVGKGSDHLQLIKFWPSRAPGKGSAAGRKFLAPPYYSQRAVFASLWALFNFIVFLHLILFAIVSVMFINIGLYCWTHCKCIFYGSWQCQFEPWHPAHHTTINLLCCEFDDHRMRLVSFSGKALFCWSQRLCHRIEWFIGCDLLYWDRLDIRKLLLGPIPGPSSRRSPCIPLSRFPVPPYPGHLHVSRKWDSGFMTRLLNRGDYLLDSFF